MQSTPTLRFSARTNEVARLGLRLRAAGGGWEDLTGRVFSWAVLNGAGETLDVAAGTVSVHGGISTVFMQFDGLAVTALLDSEGEAVEWPSQIVESVTGGVRTQALVRLSIGRGVDPDQLPGSPGVGGPPALILEIPDSEDVITLRAEGADGRTAMQVLIDAGLLAADATTQDYLDLLQTPANEAGESVLLAIAAAGLVVTGPGGTIDVAEAAALLAITQAAAEVTAEGGTLDQAVTAYIAAAAAPGGILDDAIQAVLVPAQAAVVATGDAQVLRVEGVGDVQQARLEDVAADLITDLGDTADDLGAALAVAASARIFNTEAEMLLADAEGEAGSVPETYGQKATTYHDRSGVAVRAGRTMLLGAGAESAISWAAMQREGEAPSGATIDINFLDLAFSDGRWARNKLVTPAPVLFTFITNQTVTVDATGNASLDFWATKRWHEDETVRLEIEVTEAVTAAASANVIFSLIESAASDPSSPTTLASTAAISKTNLTVGTKVYITIPAAQAKRYIGVYFDVTTGPLTAGKFSVRTRCDTAKPSLNFFVFDQPPFRNQGSGPTFGAVAGGVQQITFAANQTINLNGARRVTESGQPYIMEILAEGGTGSGGGQLLRYGPTNAYATTPTLAEGVNQVCQTVFDGTDNGLVSISTTSGGTANIGLKRIRAAPGTILPDWSNQHQGHAFSSFKRRGGLGRQATYLADLGDALNKVTIIKNAGLARTVYSAKRGMTLFMGVYIPAGTGGNDVPLLVPVYDNSASPTISSATAGILLDTFSHTVGELSMRPNQSASFETGYIEPKPGWHILALRCEQEAITLWYDGVPVLRSYTPWQGMEIMGWWLNAYASTFNMQPTSVAIPTANATLTDIDRALTDEEMLLEFTRHRADMRNMGRRLAIDEYMFCVAGTSRRAWSSLPAWPHQMYKVVRPTNADGSNRWQVVNVANGGMSYLGVDAAATISTVTRTSNVVTIVTTAAHGLSASIGVTMSGINDDSFNGTWLPTIVNTTTFTYPQTGPDATSYGGVATPHRDDFFSVFYREVIPFLRGRRWAGGRAVLVMPDIINDAGSIGKAIGAAAPVGAPAGWDTAKNGAQNLYDLCAKRYATEARAEMAEGDLIVSNSAEPRNDSFGVSSGFTPTGFDNWNALLEGADWLNYVDKNVSYRGTAAATAAGFDAAGYLNADKLHESPSGSLFEANHFNTNFVSTLP